METNKELIDQLREYAGNAGYSHQDYADMMRLAATALADANRKNLELTRVNHEQRLQEQRLDAALSRALSQRSEAEQHNKLLNIIGACYQIAGAHGAPEHILDVLCDPERATDAQVNAMLPYEPAPSAAAGEQVLLCHPDITKRIRSIVDLLGLQSDIPEDDLTGYEWAVLGLVRCEIKRLKAAAQPTPAQGDAVPVATKCAVCNGEGWVRDIYDMEQGRIRCTKCATRQSSADAVLDAFKALIKKNTHRRPKIVGDDVEYQNVIETFQIGRDVIEAVRAAQDEVVGTAREQKPTIPMPNPARQDGVARKQEGDS